MIEFKNVAKYYKTKTGVAEGIRNINVKFNNNEFVAITGESGSGKTTLLNVLSGFDSYEDGEVLINGEETSHFTVKDWENFRAKNVGFVFQNYNIIESYSVYQNIIIALDNLGFDNKKKKERALKLIEQVGLSSHTHHKAAKLSGGQKQRVVIARALAKDAPIILADEPTGNLDKTSGNEILTLLKEISKDKLVILVTHNFEEAKPYITRNVVMEDGTIKDDKIIVKSEIKEEMALDLSEAKNTKYISKSFKLAYKNLFATPRRTTFLLTLSLLTMVIFLFFFSNLILSSRVSFVDGNDNYIFILNKDGSDFTKETYEAFINKYQTKYREVFIGFPETEIVLSKSQDGYDFNNYYQIKNIAMLKDDSGFSKTDIIIPADWFLEDYSVGDSINTEINGVKYTFRIKEIKEGYDYSIYLHKDFLYDMENFRLGDVFGNKAISELQIVALDRGEINNFKSIIPEQYRIIDPYLRYEDMGKAIVSILTFFLWLVLFGILTVLFLVTFNILKNMMDSRNKDIAIYRSIGITEREVGLMILFEQIIVAITSFVVVFAGLNLLAKVNLTIYQTVRFLTFRDYFTIVMIFLILSLMQGLKFNKKVFNLTVIESLKEGN